jgi:hypothetical protein
MCIDFLNKGFEAHCFAQILINTRCRKIKQKTFIIWHLMYCAKYCIFWLKRCLPDLNMSCVSTRPWKESIAICVEREREREKERENKCLVGFDERTWRRHNLEGLGVGGKLQRTYLKENEICGCKMDLYGSR